MGDQSFPWGRVHTSGMADKRRGSSAFARLATVLVALVALMSAQAATAERADALNVVGYCEKVVPPRTKCSDSPARHTYDNNTANGVQGRNNAFGRKCEKMTWWSNERELWSRRCASRLSVTGYWYDGADGIPDCNCGPNTEWLLKVWVGNDLSDGYMYLDGRGAY